MTCNGSGFEPSVFVEAFHDIPHVDIDLKPSTDQFAISQAYFETLIIWACLPILVCVCFFIVLIVYYIFLCCCCCCCGDKKNSSKVARRACATFVIIILVLCIVGVGASLWVEIELGEGVERVLTNVRNINDAVVQVSTESAVYDSSLVDSSLREVLQGITDSSGANKDEAEAATDVLLVANGDLASAFEAINDTVSQFDFTDQEDAISFFETVRHWSIIGFFGLLVLFFLLVIISALCFNKAFFIIVLFILFFLSFIMWLGTGGSLGFLILSSDICSDPDGVIKNNTKLASSDAINYYLSCNNDCPNPFDADIADANAAYETIEEQQSIVRVYIEENMLDVASEFEKAVEQFMEGYVAIDNITTFTECDSIHEYYSEILMGACDTGFFYGLIQFGLACYLSIFMLMLLITGGAFTALLCNKSMDDVDGNVAYDYGNEGPSTWEAYGSSQRYHSAGSYHATTTNTTGDSFTLSTREPPKYSDLPTATTNGETTATTRMSGSYDHFDT